MNTPLIPESLIHLLERPLYGVLATVGRDDTARVSPMWFEFDGDVIRFTHTTKRAKYRSLQRNPSMSLAVYDPDRPTHYIEVIGHLVEAPADPTAALFLKLARRYGNPNPTVPSDSADRVILTMAIDRVVGQ